MIYREINEVDLLKKAQQMADKEYTEKRYGFHKTENHRFMVGAKAMINLIKDERRTN